MSAAARAATFRIGVVEDNYDVARVILPGIEYSVPVGEEGVANAAKALNLTAPLVREWEIVRSNPLPRFPEGTHTRRRGRENVEPGIPVGERIRAGDSNTWPGIYGSHLWLSYRLEGVDADHFRLRRLDGQILTHQPLDYEDRSTYDVTVLVRDWFWGEASIDVTIEIEVEDVDEGDPPSPPPPQPDPPPQPPPDPPPPPDTLTAGFAVSVECPDELCRAKTGETVTFTGLAKVVTGRSWNFGDGTEKTASRETTHSWSAPGFYEVSDRPRDRRRARLRSRAWRARPGDHGQRGLRRRLSPLGLEHRRADRPFGGCAPVGELARADQFPALSRSGSGYAGW